MALSEAQKEQFNREGFLKLGQVLPADELARLQQRMDEIMLGKAKLDYDRMLMQLDGDTGKYGDLPDQTQGFKGPTLNYRKIENLELDPLFLAYMQKPIFSDLCVWTYGAHASISCFRAMFMNKPAGKGTVLPWHQDGGDGWGLDRDPLLTVWLALDPATKANGCVKVIPGSHQLGLLSKAGHVITAEQEAEFCRPEKTAYLELQPGEAVILHNWLLHGSDTNATTIPRRAFSVCYMDARTLSKRGASFPVIFNR